MPKRGLGAQVAVFAIVVVCVVAAIGVVSLTQSEATSASSSETHSATSTVEATTCAPPPGESGNATVTITQTAGQWPGCACALVDSNANGTLYVSTNAVVGDDVCVAASMSKSTVVSFEVIGPTGVFFSTPGCVNSAFTAVSCEAYWDTAQTYGGNQIQPGDYELIATGDSQSLRANFTLGPGGTSVATSSTSSSYCIQTGIHGTLYVRVVADNTSKPISGATVTATIINYCTPNYQTDLGLTNSTGHSSELGWTGSFLVNVVYAGTSYTFPASTSGAVSLVTLNLPSGVAIEQTIGCGGLGCQSGTTTVTASSSIH